MSEQDVKLLLGQLIAKLDGVERTLSDNDRHAKDSREKVYKALEDIRTDAQATRTRLDSIETTIDQEVKPVVKGVLDWRSRAIGAATILGFIGTLMVLALTAAKELLLDIWRLMVNR